MPAQGLKTILHFTATLALCQFVRDSQLGGPAIRSAAVGGFRVPDQIPDLLMLEGMVMYILGEFLSSLVSTEPGFHSLPF